MFINPSSQPTFTSFNASSVEDPFFGERVDDSSHKPYSLSFFYYPEYLHARVEAESINVASASEYMQAIANEVARTGNRRLIIERDIPLAMPMAKIFLVTEAIDEEFHDIRFAFVNPYTEIDDRMAFLVLVAQNRGHDVSVHRTVADARVWLLK